ncbi:MAG: methyltransferase, partial [Treponema sp.]|nr:methyltransferase [Treponema sp.]
MPEGRAAGTEAYITKEVHLKFRGGDFDFALSRGLFSSADIDTGTRMLLRVFSERLDAGGLGGPLPPRRILDAGCG